MLLDRETERDRLSALLGAARAGRSAALVVRGQAGIGKSALLDWTVEQAWDMTVLRAAGVESETAIAFSGLSELLRPALRHLPQLPGPQRAALEGALAIAPATAGDRFAVAAGTLSLLAAAAEAGPVLVIVDDVQWIDVASAEAIVFTVRRLRADGIAVLFAAREGERTAVDVSGIEEMHLGGLDHAACVELLNRGAKRRIAPSVVDHLIQVTGGNPLALVEIPPMLGEAQLIGSEPLDEPLQLGQSIGRALRRRVTVLSNPAQLALLVAAANDSAELDGVTAALARLATSPRSLREAEDAGIVRLDDGRVMFSHPLLRSAVYHGARQDERREVHAALAASLAEAGAADRAAWHLGAAAQLPDEAVATALEEAATRARGRRGYAAAAAALERAAQLSPASANRVSRLHGAAHAWFQAGRIDRTLELLDEALAVAEHPILRAEGQHLRGRALTFYGQVMTAHRLLVREAALVEGLDSDKASQMLVDAVHPAVMAGEVAVALSTARKADTVARAAGPKAVARAQATLIHALILNGDSAQTGELDAEGAVAADPHDLFGMSYDALSLLWTEQYERAARLLDRILDEGRDMSALAALALPLATHADLDFRMGHWPAALADAAEAVQLAEETGQAANRSYALVTLARVEAGMGRADECRAHAAEVRPARLNGADSLLVYADAALGLLELGLGRTAEAVALLERVDERARRHGLRDPSVVTWGPDLIEGYIREGRTDDAKRALAAFEVQAHATKRTWAMATAARCRGLLADADDFEEHFECALGWHDATLTPFSRARTLLALGGRLRRARRLREAGDILSKAAGLFDRLGAEPWLAQARAELAASGRPIHATNGAGLKALTPQELQVALRIAGGDTNREASAALFLSPKTVEFHLSKVYRKLGLRSRSELTRHLTRRNLSRSLHGPAASGTDGRT